MPLSCGIVCQVYNTDKFIFIKRQCSIELGLIIAGKYNEDQLQIYLNCLSNKEYFLLLTQSFESLFKSNFSWKFTKYQKQKFDNLKTTLKWRKNTNRNYEYIYFPKGRPKPNETPKQTAIREFHEETGMIPDHITDITVAENYQGTDSKFYTNIYFLGFIYEKNIVLDKFDKKEVSEVVVTHSIKHYPKNRIGLFRDIYLNLKFKENKKNVDK